MRLATLRDMTELESPLSTNSFDMYGHGIRWKP
jgi:hypothetical protein